MNEKQLKLVLDKFLGMEKAKFDAQYLADLAKMGLDWRVFRQAFIDALEEKKLSYLSQDQLIELAELFSASRDVKKALFQRLSPSNQHAHANLLEITTTANVASFPVPVGYMTRPFPGQKKKIKVSR